MTAGWAPARWNTVGGSLLPKLRVPDLSRVGRVLGQAAVPPVVLARETLEHCVELVPLQLGIGRLGAYAQPLPGLAAAT